MQPQPAIAPQPADRVILRELAARVAEIAALPVQEQGRARWRRLNALRPERPMVLVDQVCWHELEAADPAALTPRCQDPFLREYELQLRRTLFQWRHFPVDMVVEPWIGVPLAVSNSGFGIAAHPEERRVDSANPVASLGFANQLANDADIEKIQRPIVTHDAAESARRLEQAHAIFDGEIEVRPWGYDPYLSCWDPIATWMGAGEVLLALADRPDFMHEVMERVTNGYLSLLDQLEEQGLLCGPQPLIHCTGAYSDELPPIGQSGRRWTCRDMWMFGMAQVLGSASPAMFRNFEVPYAARICARFGLVYYGCCEPLHARMDGVRKIPGVRKVSMSPWADQQRGAAGIGRDFVFSRKPNPALLAMDGLDADAVRADLVATRAACAKEGCPLEYILKDLSTIRYQPERLFTWARIAMEVAQG